MKMKGVCGACLVALVAFMVVGMREIPVGVGCDVRLGDATYDAEPVVTPRASGALLRAISRVITSSPVGSLIRRILLNGNRVSVLRELSTQAKDQGALIMYYPVEVLSSREYAVHEQLHDPALLVDGLDVSSAVPYWGVMDYAKAYRSGSTTPTHMMRRFLSGEKSTRDEYGAFMSVIEDDVLAQAATSDARFAAGMPLSVFDGVPVAVKDCLAVRGHKSTEGTVTDEGADLADDLAVQRFREAGAIIVGTTVMTEYGMSPLGYNVHYKRPYNPYNSSFFSGGSSAGSAVAVSLGLVPVAIGLDGGGSIRIPAAMSGAVGMHPTFSRVAFSDSGMLASTMVHAGPIAASAIDAALAYAVMGAPAAGHPYFAMNGALGPPPVHVHQFDDVANLTGVRIGIFGPHFNDSDPEIRDTAYSAISSLVARGATVVPIVIPNLKWLALAHGIAISSEFTSGHATEYYSGHNFEPASAIQVALGLSISATEFIACNRIRAWAFNYTKYLFEDIDVIGTPTVGVRTPLLSEDIRSDGLSDSTLVLEVRSFTPQRVHENIVQVHKSWLVPESAARLLL